MRSFREIVAKFDESRWPDEIRWNWNWYWTKKRDHTPRTN